MGPAGPLLRVAAALAALGGLLVGSLAAGAPVAPPPAAETVVLVHGLGRTSASMTLLAHRLRRAGFRVVRPGYPSTLEPSDRLVDRLGETVDACCGDAPESVHFVTHSMGGILVRDLLADRETPHRGRVVMLSPPNRGSEVADAMAESRLMSALMGPAGIRLGTGPGSLPNRLGPVTYEAGVIAGDRSLNPLYSRLIPGPDDGKVAVARADVEGSADFIVVPASHTFIMNDAAVAREVIHFLHHGRFSDEARRPTEQPREPGPTGPATSRSPRTPGP